MRGEVELIYFGATPSRQAISVIESFCFLAKHFVGKRVVALFVATFLHREALLRKLREARTSPVTGRIYPT